MLIQLIGAIYAFDYPRWKLDVKIVVEPDDHETFIAIMNMELPRIFEVLITPNYPPKTKAKACNYALLFARGAYVVIFDAEDIPSPTQLKKAIKKFTAHPEISCLQAALKIYNHRTNFITSSFHIEYEVWHEIRLRALYNTNLPSPLCGSSNHIRTDILRKIGGWDAYNVTEDAELGIRMYIHNLSIAQLDSVTLEEAPSSLRVWYTQRIRWTKGFVITYLLLARHPKMLRCYFNLRAFSALTALLFMTQFVSQISCTLVFMSYMLADNIDKIPIHMCLLLMFVNVIINFTQAYTLNTIKERRIGLQKWLAYLFYSYVLIPIATTASCWHLVAAPHKWGKTKHKEIHMP